MATAGSGRSGGSGGSGAAGATTGFAGASPVEPAWGGPLGPAEFGSCILAAVLLFQKQFHEGLENGQITITFRRWDKARVKAGGRYRCHPIGVLEVDQVDRVKARSISEGEARSAGFSSRAELLRYLSGARPGQVDDDTELFRVALHHGGDGDRAPIALDDDLSDQDVAAIDKKLERLDRNEAWTMKTLRLIECHPRVAARILAQKLGRERDPFKIDVRKLKRLGLTQSFEVGYEISPRGRAYLARARRRG